MSGLLGFGRYDFGQSEVKNLHYAIARKKKIFRFQISVHDAPIMRRSQSQRRLFCDLNHLAHWDLANLQPLTEGLAFEKFGHQIRGVLSGGTEAVNCQDVGMIQGGSRLGLLLKTAQATRV